MRSIQNNNQVSTKFIGRLIWATIATILVFTVAGAISASASSANISKSYNSAGDIPNGSIVSVASQATDTVETANIMNGNRLIGVAVASKESLLAIDSGSGKIQVATSGTVNTLVSTVGGDVKVGDQISVSPFNGIGMKSAGTGRIIGVAQSALNDKSTSAETQSVTDKSGKPKQVKVGYIKLTIGIANSRDDTGSQNLTTLQKLVHSMTGRTISTFRILISLVVAILALAALVTLIYASIYGSIISIGRNPLAKKAVLRSLVGVLLMSLAVAAIAIVTIYFLLG